MTEPQKSTPLTRRRDESIARENYKSKCWDVIFAQWPNVRETCNLHWNSDDADAVEDCQVEKTVLREHVEVFEHGAIMTIVVFGALRLTAHPKFHPFVDRYIKPVIRLTPPKKKLPPPPAPKTAFKSSETTGNNINMKAPKSAHVKSGRQFKSFLEHKRDTHVERIYVAAEAPHDFMVATLMGISATCFFLRPSQMRLDFEEMPLCPGRSFVAEHMCEDFIKVYRETDPQVFQIDPHNPEANVKSFHQFAVHCILRSAYIEKRKESLEPKPLVLPEDVSWEELEEEVGVGVL